MQSKNLVVYRDGETIAGFFADENTGKDCFSFDGATARSYTERIIKRLKEIYAIDNIKIEVEYRF
jgi:hypothetical protein